MPDEERIIAFDIETEPELARIPELPDPPIDSRLKNPEKIEAAKKEARAEQVAKMALDPHYGRVISCAFALGEKSAMFVRADGKAYKQNDPEKTRALLFDKETIDEHERELLQRIALQLIKCNRMVSFNGAGFDGPFLARRAAILGINFPYIEMGKYRVLSTQSRHCDVMRVLHEFDGSNPLGRKRNLATYAKELLGIEQPEDIADKLAYSTWFSTGQIVQLARANTWDAVTTLRLYEVCRRVYP